MAAAAMATGPIVTAPAVSPPAQPVDQLAEPVVHQDLDGRNPTEAKQFVKFRPWLKASATVEQGNRRPSMEDRICISKFAYKNKTFFIFLLLDGHAGAQVADFASQHFAEIMGREVIRQGGHHTRIVIKDTFLEVNRLVSHFPSGSTASLLLVIEDKKHPLKRPEIWVANVGDSTVYGVSYESGARKLSVDHNVKVKAEQERILRDGTLAIIDGYVATPSGHMLAVTRALGDSDFGPIVTAEPHIVHVKHPYPLFVLASDGIWDVMNGKEVWQKLNPPKERRAWRDSAYRLNHWRNTTFDQHDNTSLIVVHLDDPKKAAKEE